MDGVASPYQNAECGRRHLRLLIGHGLVLSVLTGVVAAFAPRFAFGVPTVERPILEMLGLFGAAFVVYLSAVRLAVRCGNSPKALAIIGGFSLVLRAILIPTDPIQEIDIYRYMWDGAVTAAGVNPYSFSPQQVRAAEGLADVPEELQALVAVKNRSQSLSAILDRVHFAELPTVYPPVSQFVFALASLSTPSHASVGTHLIVMKLWLVLFDIAIIAVLFLILKHCAKPIGWAVAYAWCPLVVKEIANSGHLDSIAIFLTTAAAYLALNAFFPQRNAASDGKGRTDHSMILAFGAAITLGLAVGAKLYPIVLVPVFISASLAVLGSKRAVVATGIGGVTIVAVCSPMWFGPSPHDEPSKQVTSADLQPLVASDSMPTPPSPMEQVDTTRQESVRSLKEFLSRWEMNDLLFSIVSENLKSPTAQTGGVEPWFVVLPQSFRADWNSALSRWTGLAVPHTSFMATRVVTIAVLLMLTIVWCRRLYQSPSAYTFLNATFLTLAWFWMLLPTQNPWYWCWCLPFVPFAGNRLWLLMSGLVFLYYSRFWFGYHFGETTVWGTPYRGAQFFDFVVPWVEFAPWLIGLLITELVYKRACRQVDCASDEQI